MAYFGIPVAICKYEKNIIQLRTYYFESMILATFTLTMGYFFKLNIYGFYTFVCTTSWTKGGPKV